MINLYVDADGVVADFEGYWNQRLIDLGYPGGTETEDKDRQVYRSEIRGVGVFNQLEILPSARKLLDELYYFRQRGVNVQFLTASGVKDPDIIELVREQKLDWFQNVLRTDIPVIVVGQKSAKQAYVSSKFDVIIDDNQGTIDNWNKNGGTALLYTEDTAKETMIKLRNVIESLIEMEQFQ